MAAVVQARNTSMDVGYQNAESTRLVHGDEETANSILDQFVRILGTEDENLYQQARKMEALPDCYAKFQGIRDLINSSPLFRVVPDEFNAHENGSILLVKKITVASNQQTTTALVGKTAIAQIQDQNRVELTTITVAQQASDAIDNAIRNTLIFVPQRSNDSDCCCVIV